MDKDTKKKNREANKEEPNNDEVLYNKRLRL
jgi:hypothetical protein